MYFPTQCLKKALQEGQQVSPCWSRSWWKVWNRLRRKDWLLTCLQNSGRVTSSTLLKSLHVIFETKKIVICGITYLITQQFNNALNIPLGNLRNQIRFILNSKHNDSENAFITRLSLRYMTYFHNYPITGLYILYKQFWQKDLNSNFNVNALITGSGAKMPLPLTLLGLKYSSFDWVSFQDCGSRGRLRKYFFSKPS